MDGEPGRFQLTQKVSRHSQGAQHIPVRKKGAMGRDPSCIPRLMQGTGDSPNLQRVPRSQASPSLAGDTLHCDSYPVPLPQDHCPAHGPLSWTRGNWFLRSHLSKNCSGVGVLLSHGTSRIRG